VHVLIAEGGYAMLSSRLLPIAIVLAVAVSSIEGIALATSGGGLSDPGAAALADKCQTAIKKAGRAFVAKKLKSVAKCAGGVSKCVQTKNSDAGCLAKAEKACTATLQALAAAQLKTATTIADKCASVAAADLLSGPGLGFGLVGIACIAEFGTVANDHATIGQCIARQHDCRTGRLLSFQHPRLDASIDLVDAEGKSGDACFTDYGGDGDLGDPGGMGKALVKCGNAITKAGGNFALAKLGNMEKCVDTVFSCIQKKPTDATCITKAQAKCGKAFSKIATARAKLGPAIDKGCAGVDVAALVAANGGDVGALAIDCAAHGVVALATLADFEQCLQRTHDCLVEDLMFLEAPRTGQLLADGGQIFSSPFCPAPLPACVVPIQKRFRRYPAAEGEVFFDRTVPFDYTGGTVVLSQDPDGTGDVFVDDELIMTVTRPDQTTVVFDQDYSNGCSGQIIHGGPHDVTSLFQVGLNSVRVQFKNTCGANASAESFWLVGCGGS